MSLCSGYIPFGPLKVGTSFLVYTNILVISRSDLSSKVMGQGQMNYISHYTCLYSTEACSEGQSQVKAGQGFLMSRSYQGQMTKLHVSLKCFRDVLRSVHTWNLLGMSCSLNTTRVHSHLLFGLILSGLKYSINGLFTYFLWLPELNSSRNRYSSRLINRRCGCTLRADGTSSAENHSQVFLSLP